MENLKWLNVIAGQPFISADDAVKIFETSIVAWHEKNESAVNPFLLDSVEHVLFKKNQVDTVQWHLEDEIRRPDNDATTFIALKRRIDLLNQQRTDLVESIDEYFLQSLGHAEPLAFARLQSESPAWMLDRMSILQLKIYHMKEQTDRTEAGDAHTESARFKYAVLTEQRTDLSFCYNTFLKELTSGTAYFKRYRQMKMYNDKNLNPALYTPPTKT